MVHAASDLKTHVRQPIISETKKRIILHSAEDPPPEVYSLVTKILTSVRALQKKEQQVAPYRDEQSVELHRMIADATFRRDSLQLKLDNLIELLSQSESLVGPENSNARRAEVEQSARVHATAMAEVLSRLNARVVEALAE
jgi:hypothetical protein